MPCWQILMLVLLFLVQAVSASSGGGRQDVEGAVGIESSIS